MARSQFYCPMHGKSIDEILQIFEAAMCENDYSKKLVKNEEIYCKGDGVLALMQCFSLVFRENAVVIEAWVNDAVLGESELKGFSGIFIKKKMRALAEKLSLLFSSSHLKEWTCPECCRENSPYSLSCACGYQKELS
ncbi:MAG: hypothetical protein IJ489_09645 [Clostridia bacterium]|nr:hypothetical protein [Clostridia bacterium]